MTARETGQIFLGCSFQVKFHINVKTPPTHTHTQYFKCVDICQLHDVNVIKFSHLKQESKMFDYWSLAQICLVGPNIICKIFGVYMPISAYSP